MNKDIIKEMKVKVSEYFKNVDEGVLDDFREVLSDGVLGMGMCIDDVKEFWLENSGYDCEKEFDKLLGDEKFNEMIVWDCVVNDFEYVSNLILGY